MDGRRLFTVGPALDERQDQPQQAKDGGATQQADSTHRSRLPAVYQPDDDSADDDQENRNDHDESPFVLAPERAQIRDGMWFVWHSCLPGTQWGRMTDSPLRRLQLNLARVREQLSGL